MIATPLVLPYRTAPPRSQGLTVVIDNGIPTELFEDVVSSAGDHLDLVKFGWGTALVSDGIREKIACLERHGVGFLFGGTLFEKFFAQDLVEDYFAFCRRHGCRYVEISDGTIVLSPAAKTDIISQAAREFVVLSEVGYKDPERSKSLDGDQWAAAVAAELAAGASYVVTEARESGRGGICEADGSLRFDVVERIVESGAPVERLVFEAPTKELQSFFITRFGANVNLANIAPHDVIALETLRLGLRSDTFVHFELERRHDAEELHRA